MGKIIRPSLVALLAYLPTNASALTIAAWYLCNTNQETEIDSLLAQAKNTATRIHSGMNYASDLGLQTTWEPYQVWFGSFDQARWNSVAAIVGNTADYLTTTNVVVLANVVDTVCANSPSASSPHATAQASVIGHQRTIVFFPDFWNQTKAEQLRLFIEEVVHLDNPPPALYGTPADEVYGDLRCRTLAENAPDKAVLNPATYSYFFSDHESLSCSRDLGQSTPPPLNSALECFGTPRTCTATVTAESGWCDGFGKAEWLCPREMRCGSGPQYGTDEACIDPLDASSGCPAGFTVENQNTSVTLAWDIVGPVHAFCGGNTDRSYPYFYGCSKPVP